MELARKRELWVTLFALVVVAYLVPVTPQTYAKNPSIELKALDLSLQLSWAFLLLPLVLGALHYVSATTSLHLTELHFRFEYYRAIESGSLGGISPGRIETPLALFIAPTWLHGTLRFKGGFERATARVIGIVYFLVPFVVYGMVIFRTAALHLWFPAIVTTLVGVLMLVIVIVYARSAENQRRLINRILPKIHGRISYEHAYREARGQENRK